MITYREVRNLIDSYFSRARKYVSSFRFDVVSQIVDELYREVYSRGFRSSACSNCIIEKKVVKDENYPNYGYSIWDSEFCCTYDVELMFIGHISNVYRAFDSLFRPPEEDNEFSKNFENWEYTAFLVWTYYRFLWNGKEVSTKEDIINTVYPIEEEEDDSPIEDDGGVCVEELMYPYMRKNVVRSIDDIEVVYIGGYAVLNDGTIIAPVEMYEQGFDYSIPGYYIAYLGMDAFDAVHGLITDYIDYIWWSSLMDEEEEILDLKKVTEEVRNELKAVVRK